MLPHPLLRGGAVARFEDIENRAVLPHDPVAAEAIRSRPSPQRDWVIDRWISPLSPT
ncbi:MAG: hypothetical protein M0Z51_08050 [Propionibacterium sp.]|nr:hypothetical protein [Propionibacterium sp.]